MGGVKSSSFDLIFHADYGDIDQSSDCLHISLGPLVELIIQTLFFVQRDLRILLCTSCRPTCILSQYLSPVLWNEIIGFP